MGLKQPQDGEPKSIGREVTFEQDTNDFDLLKRVLKGIAEDVCRTAKEEKYTFRTVVLKIRYEDFETHTNQKSFKQQVSIDDVKRASAYILALFKSKKKIRLIGLRLTNLKKV